MRLQNDRTLDDTDHRLLTLLQANARRSATALAKELGLSRTAVQARIVRLEREGVITAYVPVLGKPLNNGLEAVVTLVLNRRPCRAIYQRFKDWPEVLTGYSVAGTTDVMLIVRTPTPADLSALMDRLSAVVGVSSASSSVILETFTNRMT